MTTKERPVYIPHIYITLALVTISLSFLSYYYLSILLTNPLSILANPSLRSGSAILFILTLTGLVGTFIPVTILIHKRIERILFYAAFQIGLLVLVSQINPSALGIIALISIPLLVAIDLIAQYDLRVHIRPNIPHIYTNRVGFIFFIAIISFSYLSYESTKRQIGTIELAIPEQLVDQSLQLVQPFVTDQIDAQTQNLIIQEGVKFLDKQSPLLAELPFDDKASLIRGDVSPTLREKLNSYGFTDTQIDSIATMFQGSIATEANIIKENLLSQLTGQVRSGVTTQLNDFLNNNKNYAPWIIAISTFFTLSTIGFVLKYFAIIFGYLEITLLEKIGWVQQQSHVVEAKKYVIK